MKTEALDKIYHEIAKSYFLEQLRITSPVAHDRMIAQKAIEMTKEKNDEKSA